MKLSLRNLVDAELPLTESELGEIFRNMNRRNRLSHKETVLLFATYFGPPILLLGLAAFVMNIIGYRMVVSTILAVLMCAWFCIAIALVSRHAWYAVPFRRELNRRGHSVCVWCGYWLRGLPRSSMHCPECGKRIEHHGKPAS